MSNVNNLLTVAANNLDCLFNAYNNAVDITDKTTLTDAEYQQWYAQHESATQLKRALLRQYEKAGNYYAQAHQTCVTKEAEYHEDNANANAKAFGEAYAILQFTEAQREHIGQMLRAAEHATAVLMPNSDLLAHHAKNTATPPTRQPTSALRTTEKEALEKTLINLGYRIEGTKILHADSGPQAAIKKICDEIAQRNARAPNGQRFQETDFNEVETMANGYCGIEALAAYLFELSKKNPSLQKILGKCLAGLDKNWVQGNHAARNHHPGWSDFEFNTTDDETRYTNFVERFEKIPDNNKRLHQVLTGALLGGTITSGQTGRGFFSADTIAAIAKKFGIGVWVVDKDLRPIDGVPEEEAGCQCYNRSLQNPPLILKLTNTTGSIYQNQTSNHFDLLIPTNWAALRQTTVAKNIMSDSVFASTGDAIPEGSQEGYFTGTQAEGNETTHDQIQARFDDFLFDDFLNEALDLEAVSPAAQPTTSIYNVSMHDLPTLQPYTGATCIRDMLDFSTHPKATETGSHDVKKGDPRENLYVKLKRIENALRVVEKATQQYSNPSDCHLAEQNAETAKAIVTAYNEGEFLDCFQALHTGDIPFSDAEADAVISDFLDTTATQKKILTVVTAHHEALSNTAQITTITKPSANLLAPEVKPAFDTLKEQIARLSERQYNRMYGIIKDTGKVERAVLEVLEALKHKDKTTAAHAIDKAYKRCYWRTRAACFPKLQTETQEPFQSLRDNSHTTRLRDNFISQVKDDSSTEKPSEAQYEAVITKFLNTPQTLKKTFEILADTINKEIKNLRKVTKPPLNSACATSLTLPEAQALTEAIKTCQDHLENIAIQTTQEKNFDTLQAKHTYPLHLIALHSDELQKAFTAYKARPIGPAALRAMSTKLRQENSYAAIAITAFNNTAITTIPPGDPESKEECDMRVKAAATYRSKLPALRHFPNRSITTPETLKKALTSEKTRLEEHREIWLLTQLGSALQLQAQYNSAPHEEQRRLKAEHEHRMLRLTKDLGNAASGPQKYDGAQDYPAYLTKLITKLKTYPPLKNSSVEYTAPACFARVATLRKTPGNEFGSVAGDYETHPDGTPQKIGDDENKTKTRKATNAIDNADFIAVQKMVHSELSSAPTDQSDQAKLAVLMPTMIAAFFNSKEEYQRADNRTQTQLENARRAFVYPSADKPLKKLNEEGQEVDGLADLKLINAQGEEIANVFAPTQQQLEDCVIGWAHQEAVKEITRQEEGSELAEEGKKQRIENEYHTNQQPLFDLERELRAAIGKPVGTRNAPSASEQLKEEFGRYLTAAWENNTMNPDSLTIALNLLNPFKIESEQLKIEQNSTNLGEIIFTSKEAPDETSCDEAAKRAALLEHAGFKVITTCFSTTAPSQKHFFMLRKAYYRAQLINTLKAPLFTRKLTQTKSIIPGIPANVAGSCYVEGQHPKRWRNLDAISNSDPNQQKIMELLQPVPHKTFSVTDKKELSGLTGCIIECRNNGKWFVLDVAKTRQTMQKETRRYGQNNKNGQQKLLADLENARSFELSLACLNIAHHHMITDKADDVQITVHTSSQQAAHTLLYLSKSAGPFKNVTITVKDAKGDAYQASCPEALTFYKQEKLKTQQEMYQTLGTLKQGEWKNLGDEAFNLQAKSVVSAWQMLNSQKDRIEKMFKPTENTTDLNFTDKAMLDVQAQRQAQKEAQAALEKAKQAWLQSTPSEPHLWRKTPGGPAKTPEPAISPTYKPR